MHTTRRHRPHPSRQHTGASRNHREVDRTISNIELPGSNPPLIRARHPSRCKDVRTWSDIAKCKGSARFANHSGHQTIVPQLTIHVLSTDTDRCNVPRTVDNSKHAQPRESHLYQSLGAGGYFERIRQTCSTIRKRRRRHRRPLTAPLHRKQPHINQCCSDKLPSVYPRQQARPDNLRAAARQPGSAPDSLTLPITQSNSQRVTTPDYT